MTKRAKEKGFFEDEGLFVSVEAQSNWKNVLDRVIDGQLDGSHMLSGQPIALETSSVLAGTATTHALGLRVLNE